MHQLTELFKDSPIVYVELPNEPLHLRHWFRATEVCKTLAFKNAYESVIMHCKEHQYREFTVGKGRPALYISESGVYRLLIKSKSPVAVTFQDWLTEDLLPKLRSQGYFIAQTDDETLAKLQIEVLELKEKNAFLTDDFVIRDLVQQFAINNLKYVPGVKAGRATGSGKNYVLRGHLYERWEKWSKDRLHGLEVSQEVFMKTLADYLKSQPGDKKSRIHIDSNNGFGDLENCELIPLTRAKSFLQSGVYSLGE